MLSYVKQITSPGSMHETVCSGLVHWDDSEGWSGEGDGRGVQDGEHMYTQLIHVNIWQKTPQYCKVIRLQFKKKKQLDQNPSKIFTLYWLIYFSTLLVQSFIDFD